ncbi:MAG: flagellar biosynthetic protein FliO [Clostridiaceae bacterium]|jgi:flagellar protein FliO/FliZ|nr:flagellar biosynthetic protein FliO [Clostridiaceae bacterium]
MDSVFQALLYLIGFFALLFLAYVTTRYVGRRQSNAMKSKNINVAETVMLGADKRLHLVKAGKDYLLIATTSKTVNFLSKVDMEESVEEEEALLEADNRFEFKSIFEKYADMYRSNKGKNKKKENSTPQEIEEKSDFKSNLTRLKKVLNTSRDKENGDDITNEE